MRYRILLPIFLCTAQIGLAQSDLSPAQGTIERDRAFLAALAKTSAPTVAETEQARAALDRLARIFDETGNAEAGFAVARAAETGVAGAPDMGRAAAIYGRLAEAGDMNAAYNAGHIHLTERFEGQDSSVGRRWLEEAAKNGVLAAQKGLGGMLTQGSHLPMDRAAAFGWWQMAAEQGDGEALFRVASALNWGEGVAQDLDAAYGYYQRAVDAGYTFAHYFLGVYLSNDSDTIPRDIPRAIDHFQTFLNHHPNPQANWFLATLALDGLATSDQIGGLNQHLWTAATSGMAQASFYLAVSYNAGRDVAFDNRKALLWVFIAQAQGEGRADANIPILSRGLSDDDVAQIKSRAMGCLANGFQDCPLD